MHRFFISPELIVGDRVTLPQDVSRQLTQVLRFRPGDRIVVLDGSGWEHLVTLEQVDSERSHGELTESRPSRGEPRTKITLYQGVLKASKFEIVLQKGTEVGISTFVPVFCERSVPKAEATAVHSKRYDRWRKIVTEAAEQSRRGRIPSIEKPVDFSNACDEVAGPALLPWESEEETGLRSALAQLNRDGQQGHAVSVFIGPEGGFSSNEIDYARAAGITTVTMGERILRAETAGVVAAAAILYDVGELGG